MSEVRGRRTEGRGDPPKKRMRSKSSKRLVPKLSPLQERLKDSDCYINVHRDDIINTINVKERLELVNSLLSDDVTDISRVWPNKLINKDSRIRRELSEKGSEHFKRGEHDKVLEYYNKALMFSSGKGTAHTLARRAAFFLSTGEPNLALRDLSTALEYGCLQTELMDFLLSHHTPTGKDKYKKCAKYKWADNIREYLDAANSTKKGAPKSTKDDIFNKIMESIMNAAKEQNVEQNMEVKELELPTITERNPLIPAFSESAAIFFDPEKGRMMKARRDIKAGELICVDSPICSILSPENASSLANHCIQCFRFTKAPLPCDNCCTVVFCSKECKGLALKSYHKYECQMKIYELFQHEGREVFGLFMALRAITQKPLQYFTENRQELEKLMERTSPVHPLPGRAYLSSDYRTLVNLTTQLDDLDEDVVVRNAVLSVFFCRFLKFSGYFGNLEKPKPVKGKAVVNDTELFILRILHQLIHVQAFNSHSVHEMSETFDWVKIGSSINPSMALVNHSCDSNVIRCNLNRNSILVAGRHIVEGEEITDSYTVHFRTSNLNQRQYHTLKNYNFSCECEACEQDWPLEDDVPYDMPRIPNFEQEIIFKKRTGDKKDIVKGIIDARRVVEKLMTEKNFEEAILAYQELCEQLEMHIRKPHIFFLQARSGISHCLWNLYCKQKSQDEEDEGEDITGRDHAKSIYRKDFTEKPQENDALNVISSGNKENETIVNDDKATEKDEERRRLLELAKQSIANSSMSLSSLKMDSQGMRDSINAIKELAKEHCSIEKVSGNITLTNEDITKILNEKEQELKALNQEMVNFNAEVKSLEIDIKERRAKEREEQNLKRLEIETEKKMKRAKETEERMRLYKEEEKKKKEQKKIQDERMKKEKEEAFQKKRIAEQKLAQEKQEKRKQELAAEEAELEELFALAGKEETGTLGDEQMNNADLEDNEKHHCRKDNEISHQPEKKQEVRIKQETNNDITVKEVKVNTGQTGEDKKDKSNSHEIEKTVDKNVNKQERKQSFINVEEGKTENNIPVKKAIKTDEDTNRCDQRNEPENVWAALRKVKETRKKTLEFNIKEPGQDTLDITNIDSFIKDLQEKAKRKQEESKSLPKDISEDCQLEIIKEDEEIESNQTEQGKQEEIAEIKPTEPFDYDAWNRKTQGFFTTLIEEDNKIHAKDKAYLDGLKQKIHEKIKVDLEKKEKNKKKSVPEQIKREPIRDNGEKVETKKKLGEFESLQAKNKEKKRKKKEEKFKQSEEKLQDFSLKSQKLDKVSKEAEEEIKRIKEMAHNIMKKNAKNEKEFKSDFETLVSPSKREETKEYTDTNNPDVHWTEEERNKWPAQDESKAGFTNALSMLRVAALGKSEVASELKDTISKAKDAVKSVPLPSKKSLPSPITSTEKTAQKSSHKERILAKDSPSKTKENKTVCLLPEFVKEEISTASKPKEKKSEIKIDNTKYAYVMEKDIGLRQPSIDRNKGKNISENPSGPNSKPNVVKLNFGKEARKKEVNEEAKEKEKADQKIVKIKFNKPEDTASSASLSNVKPSSKERNSKSLSTSAGKQTENVEINESVPKDDHSKNIGKDFRPESGKGKLEKPKTRTDNNPEDNEKCEKSDKVKSVGESKIKQEPILAKEVGKDEKPHTVPLDKKDTAAPKTNKASAQLKQPTDAHKISSSDQTANIKSATLPSTSRVAEDNSKMPKDHKTNDEPKTDRATTHQLKQEIDAHETSHDQSVSNKSATVPSTSKVDEEKTKKTSVPNKRDTAITPKSEKQKAPSDNKVWSQATTSGPTMKSPIVPKNKVEVVIVEEVQTAQKQEKQSEASQKTVKVHTVSNVSFIPKGNEMSAIKLGSPSAIRKNNPPVLPKEEFLGRETKSQQPLSTTKPPPAVVHSVNSVSFIPKTNEVEAIKIGSPSALRKMNADRKQASAENYQISKVATEIITLPSNKKSESLTIENYSIARVPTETFIIQKGSVQSKTGVEISQTAKVTRPPPPRSKPPPPPSFKPPPPPPLF